MLEAMLRGLYMSLLGCGFHLLDKVLLVLWLWQAFLPYAGGSRLHLNLLCAEQVAVVVYIAITPVGPKT
jgi:hypothetical protein